MRHVSTPLTLIVAAGMLLAAPALAGSNGALIELGGLSARTPPDWNKTPPKNRMRLAQFTLPRAEGDERDAELAIFHFGGGGSVKANIKRWKSIFEPPEGKSIDDVSTVRRYRLADARVTVLDLHGTYLYKARPVDPDLEAERRPDHRMIGVVFDTKRKGTYFMRAVGPRRTMKKHAPALYRWLKSFD